MFWRERVRRALRVVRVEQDPPARVVHVDRVEPPVDLARLAVHPPIITHCAARST